MRKFVIFILINIIAFQYGALVRIFAVDYCELISAPDVNQCIRALRDQGIYFVDPVGSTKSPDSCGSSSGLLDKNLSLFYPNYEDKADVASKFEAFIREKRPNSPWLSVPNIGQRIVDEGEKYNANPFIMLHIGFQESHFSTDNSTAVSRNNPFGIKDGNVYKQFPSVEAGLFDERGILAGLQDRLANHSNYKDVKTMYEYFSVHNTGQILYPGDNVRIEDPFMPGTFVSSEGDTGYGPVEYWANAMNNFNNIFGTNLSTLPPQRNDLTTLANSSNSACTGSYPPGAGGWDLPGEGPNPMVYYSQLYACNESESPKTCDESVTGAYGSITYGTGTVEQCGCGPVSAASIIATVTGKSITPIELVDWSLSNGGQLDTSCGSNWFWTYESFATDFGVTVSEQLTAADVRSSLESGKLVIVSLDAFPTTDDSVGHISIIRKYEAGNYYFADSYAGGWKNEDKPETSSRMAYSESDIAAMTAGIWAIGKK